MARKRRSVSFPFFNRVWPEGGPEHQIYGPEVLLYQTLRVVGLAPVSMKPLREGCAVTLKRPYILYSHVKYTLIALIILIGFLYDVSVKPTGISHSTLECIMWSLNVILPFLFIGIGALPSLTRTSKLLSFLEESRKIHAEFGRPSEALSTANDKQLRSQVMVIVFIIFCSTVIKLFLIVTADHNPGILMNTYNFLCFYMNDVIAALLEMQMVHIVQNIKYTVNTVNRSMRTFLQKLQRNKSVAYDGESLKEIRHITNQYLAIRRLTQKVSDSEAGLMLITFIVVAYHINTSMFRTYLAFKSTDITTKVLKLFERTMVCVQRWALLLLFVEPYHQTRQELEDTRVLVSELLCCTPSAQSPLSQTLQRFAAQLQLPSHVFVPLDVFTISRSLYTAVIGSVTTFFTIAVKYIHEWQ